MGLSSFGGYARSDPWPDGRKRWPLATANYAAGQCYCVYGHGFSDDKASLFS